MNFLKGMFLNYGKKQLLKQIEKPEFRNKLISFVNRKVDIPNLTELQEQQLFIAVYDAIKAYLIVGGK